MNPQATLEELKIDRRLIGAVMTIAAAERRGRRFETCRAPLRQAEGRQDACAMCGRKRFQLNHSRSD
ncbi:MAG: hypothetical protein ACI9VS_004382, partial [Candidatus Binatia bacterium]